MKFPTSSNGLMRTSLSGELSTTTRNVAMIASTITFNVSSASTRAS